MYRPPHKACACLAQELWTSGCVVQTLWRQRSKSHVWKQRFASCVVQSLHDVLGAGYLFGQLVDESWSNFWMIAYMIRCLIRLVSKTFSDRTFVWRCPGRSGNCVTALVNPSKLHYTKIKNILTWEFVTLQGIRFVKRCTRVPFKSNFYWRAPDCVSDHDIHDEFTRNFVDWYLKKKAKDCLTDRVS